MAGDLRYVFGTIKMAGSLERIGDYAKNIGKRTLVLAEHREIKIPSEMNVLGHTVLMMLRDIMDAFTGRDVKKAEAVWQRDWETDELTKRVMKKIVANIGHDVIRTMSDGALNVEAQTHVLFIAKNMERVGDHTTNIAEVIQFQLSGAWATSDRSQSGATMRAAV